MQLVGAVVVEKAEMRPKKLGAYEVEVMVPHKEEGDKDLFMRKSRNWLRV